MKYYNVNSTAISKIGYDVKEKKLSVLFHHGRQYEYEGVSEDTFKNFLKAPSVGKYYNQHIKGLLP